MVSVSKTTIDDNVRSASRLRRFGSWLVPGRLDNLILLASIILVAGFLDPQIEQQLVLDKKYISNYALKSKKMLSKTRKFVARIDEID